MRDSLDQHGQLNLTQGANAVFGEVSAEGLRLSLTLGDQNTHIAGTSDYNFQASPNTQVIFTAEARVATHGDAGADPTYASASLFGTTDDGEISYGITSIGTGNGTAAFSETLGVQYSFGTGGGLGFLSLGGSLRGTVSPVPEPSRAAILLLGLPVVFTLLRRRRGVDRAA
ncbi:hypothetical protein B0920_21435 [Massilia sp. KIM]|uniref:PEP-CTERM sorting domain-containing protein n=1 Tax=Massilia sp. KIM TaxID=1955422 RepID=UPI0009CBD389|nr:PEP-CTERM sorting domain-containing protein [Massilia sp. KIM]OON59844.1 hypothetical protein B0920_21435 [Massilia sp. KIM]